MTKTEEITLTLEQAKLKNMRVWDYLMKICVLLGSPLMSQLEVELQVYLQQNRANGLMLEGIREHVTQKHQIIHTKVKDALAAEAKVNARLKQFVQMCQLQIQEMQVRGQLVPDCPTSWIYTDFPVLSELTQTETQPLTVLCDHILDRYDLDKDDHLKKILLGLEVASLWHRNSKLARKDQQQPASVLGVNSHAAIPEKAVNKAAPGDATRSVTEYSTGENEKATRLQPVIVFNKEYTKVVSGGVEGDLVLRLVRMCSGVGADLTSQTAIADMLRESVANQCQLEGAGYLVHRYKKIAKRRCKATAQTAANGDSTSPFCSSDLGQVSPCVPQQMTPSTDLTKSEPKEEPRRLFLANVAKFQNKFKSASHGNCHGQKRKATDSSVCREIQTKYSKTRMETTLAALKRHVTKRHILASCH